MAPPFDQIFPPSPTFTEKHAGDQGGRVFLVTGSTSGVGLELAKMLYGLNGTVYVAGRSSEKIRAAINTIKSEVRTKTGRVEALQVDLANLASIGQSARDFLSKEDRLDVVVHNAGLMTPPAGSKTKLGHDLEMGTNCLGPFLLNHYLEPTLKRTAAETNSPLGVRVIWLSSMIAASVPKGGIMMTNDGSPKVIKNAMENYMQSKVGNVFVAAETAQRLSKDGIISVSVNPGLLNTELQRHVSSIQRMIMVGRDPSPVFWILLALLRAFLSDPFHQSVMFKEPKYGAYTELFAALSPEIDIKKSGAFILPWGRFGHIPDHIQQSIDNGKAASFYRWCDQETKPYQ
ncbi:MAG: hypothetical protein Q9163_002856 [Psora crenata]